MGSIRTVNTEGGEVLTMGGDNGSDSCPRVCNGQGVEVSGNTSYLARYCTSASAGKFRLLDIGKLPPPPSGLPELDIG